MQAMNLYAAITSSFSVTLSHLVLQCIVGCSCNAGYNGTITATLSAPFFNGSCDPVPCPAHSTGNTVPQGCSCNAGYSGSPTPSTVAPFFQGACLPVPCPGNSTGSNVPAGCSCNAGYNGTITATLSAPFFSGSCDPVPCPAHSTGNTVPQGCSCNAGYSGSPTPSTVAPFFQSACLPVPCPGNSTGSNVPAGCSCNGGYSGTITGSTSPPFFTGVCSPVPCPSFTLGSTIPQGCICNNASGYYGVSPLVPTTSSPFYNSTCTQFQSCNELLTQTALPSTFGRTTGVYYITYSSGVYPAFCDQVTNGGGWELVLKISTSAGSLWSYGSSLWTSTTTLNSNSLDESDSDAQFPQYTHGYYSQVRRKGEE